MNALLAANIGNTRVAVGLFELPAASALLSPSITASFPAPDDTFIAELEADASVEAAVFASVNPRATRAVTEWIAERFGVVPAAFPAEVPLPMENRCEPPEAVGADRLANAVAALRESGGPCLIVDAGTAVTVDAVSAEGPAFLGGAILPGMGLAAHSLAKGTALLPNLAVGEPGPAIGTSTSAAMTSGVVRGLAGAVDRLLADMCEELHGCPQIFLTGGEGPKLERLCRTPMTARPFLSLSGLAAAWQARAAAS